MGELLELADFCRRCEDELGFEVGEWQRSTTLESGLGLDSLDWVALDDLMSELGVDLFETDFESDISVAELHRIYCEAVRRQ
jgi:acyl carrier protein